MSAPRLARLVSVPALLALMACSASWQEIAVAEIPLQGERHRGFEFELVPRSQVGPVRVSVGTVLDPAQIFDLSASDPLSVAAVYEMEADGERLDAKRFWLPVVAIRQGEDGRRSIGMAGETGEDGYARSELEPWGRARAVEQRLSLVFATRAEGAAQIQAVRALKAVRIRVEARAPAEVEVRGQALEDPVARLRELGLE